MTCERCHNIVYTARASFCPRCGNRLAPDAGEGLLEAAAEVFQIVGFLRSASNATVAERKLQTTERHLLSVRQLAQEQMDDACLPHIDHCLAAIASVQGDLSAKQKRATEMLRVFDQARIDVVRSWMSQRDDPPL
jgi:hypothetical protein